MCQVPGNRRMPGRSRTAARSRPSPGRDAAPLAGSKKQPPTADVGRVDLGMEMADSRTGSLAGWLAGVFTNPTGSEVVGNSARSAVPMINRALYSFNMREITGISDLSPSPGRVNNITAQTAKRKTNLYELIAWFLLSVRPIYRLGKSKQ